MKQALLVLTIFYTNIDTISLRIHRIITMVKVRSFRFIVLFGLLWSVSQALDPEVIKNGLSSQEGLRASAALEKLKYFSSGEALSACFDPSIGDKNLDLSNSTFHQLVFDYFVRDQNNHKIIADFIINLINIYSSWQEAYPEVLENQDEEERVKILASQFVILVNEVEDCVRGPAEQRSKLGFTSRLGYVSSVLSL